MDPSIYEVRTLSDAEEYVAFLYRCNQKKSFGADYSAASKKQMVRGINLYLRANEEKVVFNLIDNYNFNWGRNIEKQLKDPGLYMGDFVKNSGFSLQEITATLRQIASRGEATWAVNKAAQLGIDTEKIMTIPKTF